MATQTIIPKEDAKEQWLAERQGFIGGSEVYELLNEKQYGKGCVRALAYRKLNFVPDYPEQVDDAILERGNILEPIVAQMYEEETGRKLRRDSLNEHGLPKARLHPSYPWAGVHVDRIVLAGPGGVKETGTAEIKTHGEGPFYNILRTGLQPGHNLQEQWGQWVKGHSWGPFIILGVFGGLPLKHFDVQHDPQMDEIFIRKGGEFADTVWGQGNLPERPFTGDDQRCKVCAFRMECRGEELDRNEALALKAEKNGKTPLVHIENATLSQALADRTLLKEEIKAREEAVDLVDSTIERELGNVEGAREGALVQGFGKVYDKLQAGRTSCELGEMMEYLKGVTMSAKKVAEEVDGWRKAINWNGIEPPLQLGQAVSVLLNAAEIPETVNNKYMKRGAPFRSIRVYPFKAKA